MTRRISNGHLESLTVGKKLTNGAGARSIIAVYIAVTSLQIVPGAKHQVSLNSTILEV